MQHCAKFLEFDCLILTKRQYEIPLSAVFPQKKIFGDHLTPFKTQGLQFINGVDCGMEGDEVWYAISFKCAEYGVFLHGV